MQEKIPPNCILVTGHAPIPKGTALYEHYKLLDLVIVIDISDDKIVDASFTVLTEVLNDFLREILVGQLLSPDICIIKNNISKRAYFPAKKAVLQAIENAYSKYQDVKSRDTYE